MAALMAEEDTAAAPSVEAVVRVVLFFRDAHRDVYVCSILT